MIHYRNFTTECMDRVRQIYAANGWTDYLRDPEKLVRAFENSLFILGAFEEGRLLGFARCVGDGEHILYIQDLILDPDYRRRGIGGELMRRVSDTYSDVRQFLLITDREDPDSNAFYRTIGLSNKYMGYPMNVYFRSESEKPQE